MKQREGYKIIINPEAKKRIDNNQCPSCGKHKQFWKRRTDWRCCSTSCTDKYVKEMVCFGWPDLREKAFKRDNYTCVLCKSTPLLPMEGYDSGWYKSEEEWKEYQLEHHAVRHFERKGGRLYVLLVDKSSLIGDHITPIAVGGDEWDLDNIQTLCLDCNRIKTKRDSGIIARARRREKLVNKGQRFLK